MKKINRLAWLLLLAFAMTACKHKKEPGNNYVSMLSFIKSQIRHVDTSIFTIIRYRIEDTLHLDSEYLRREDFRAAAHDFTELPDITEGSLAKHYTEETGFDETLNSSNITYTPDNPDDQLVQKEQMLVKNQGSESKVTDIIINTARETKDSLVMKRMLWKADQSFQVTTIRQLPGKPEETRTIKVTWNEENNE